MTDYSLTFDFGSGSVKTALVDSEHRIVASHNKTYTTYYPSNGWAVQDPETLWEALIESTHQVIMQANIHPARVKGLDISHTGSTILFVDEAGNPLSDLVLWMDGRATFEAKTLNDLFGKDQYTGKNVIAKLKWFVDHDPDLVHEAYKVIDLQGLLLFRLTNQFVYEFTGARTTRIFDVLTGLWDEARIEAVGLPRWVLPERIVRSDELVGKLTLEAARHLGLFEGTPVFGGCCDSATAVLGTANVHPGDAHVYVGTSAWLSITAERYEPLGTIRPSPIPGQWYHYLESDSGGASIDFLIRQYYQNECNDGENFYSVVGEESSDVSSFRDVLFLPFLSGASAPINNVSMRASMLNLEMSTTRGQIARAVLDGLGFNLRWLKEYYEKQHPWKINFLRGIGGGMLLPESVQTIASIMGETITTMRDPRYAGNIGLAVCIESGLKEYSEGFGILEQTMNFDQVYHPDPTRQERYERLYPIYKAAFHSLSDIYHKLNDRKDYTI